MRGLETKTEVEEKYNEVISIIENCGFEEEGYKRVIDYISEVREEKYNQFDNAEQEQIAKSEYEQNQIRKREEIREKFRNFKATTSMSFEGYKIIEYLDILSGEVVLGTGMFSNFDAALSDFFGTNATSYSNKLTKAKNEALARLKVNCIDIGANGVIAVDIDITTIGSNMIVACANGTAVKIEKIS